MKRLVLAMVVALASAGTVQAQVTKITPRGTGGFGSSTTAPAIESESAEGHREGPEQNRSFQKFISGSVSRARVPAAGVPTPDGLPVGTASPRVSIAHPSRSAFFRRWQPVRA